MKFFGILFCLNVGISIANACEKKREEKGNCPHAVCLSKNRKYIGGEKKMVKITNCNK
jgi:hypothetical protein